MKSWILAALLAVTFAGAGQAQDTTKSEAVVIRSDQVEIDLNSGYAVYTGNVIVEDKPAMEIRCEVLTLQIEGDTQEVKTITATGKVKIFLTHEKGSGIASGEQAVFLVDKDRVELTGDASMETTQGKMWGDTIFFDRISYKLKAKGNIRMEIDPKVLQKEEE